MGKYRVALAFLLSTAPVDSFHNFRPHSLSRIPQRASIREATSSQRRVSASSSGYPDNSGELLGDALSTVTNVAIDSIEQVVGDFPDTDAAEIALKQKQVGERSKSFSVTLPLASKELEGKAPLLSMGFTVAQINSGRTFSDMELNMDTLEYTKPGEDSDRAGLARRVDGDFKGLLVSSISEDGAAWAAGVRAGDILKTASATLGPKMWPKSTLDGLRSAVSSRKATTGSVEFEFQRLGEATVDNQFELTLTRPIGLQMRDSEDGYVEVTGFTENAPTLVQYAVRVGDRVLAVESSIGGKMWPVSTVDGVISAVTGRFPGKQITLRFERVQEDALAATAVAEPAKVAKKNAEVAVGATLPHKELLKRCRNIIRRYTSTDQVADQFVGKFAVPGLVADKVVDAIASAGAAIDRITLSMIMEAYISCGQSQKAIDTFEAAVGLNANGSIDKAQTVIKGKGDAEIMSNSAALDVFTVSALLKAHAKKGDLTSAKRVLMAVEGKNDLFVDGLQVASWPGTGNGGTLKPDTRCYNAVLSAAADSAATEGLEFALEMFERMDDAKDGSIAARDIATYNIVINALAKDGRFDEAIDLFYMVKKLGMNPDKFTYTGLVRAAAIAGDSEELLYDMREQGVVGDAVTYNEVIKVLCNQRKLVAAKRIVNLMEESGVSPDSRTYGLLMQGLMDANNPGAALTLFETACAEQSTVSLTENVYVYTAAITAAAALRDHERALELLSRMSSLGIKPNLKTMTALLGACMSSSRPDLAVGIYRRISNPDGYAMSKGLQALSENGNFEEALSLLASTDRQKRVLTGKQEMYCYKTLIANTLSEGDFAFARRVLDTMLGRGDIPSKSFYQAIFEAMRLFPSAKNGRLEANPMQDPNATEKFQFLLYVVDSIGKRNLPCDGPLYTAILTYGFKMGGLPKKIASLLVTAKTATAASIPDKKPIGESSDIQESAVSNWSEAFERYDEIKADLKQPTALPALVVRVGGKDVIRVLNAEKNVSFMNRAKVPA